jgi:septal ring factor EnvC (AmiA/AmiB activator)
MNLLASAESVNDFFQRKAILERILNHDENTLRDLNENKAKLSELLNNLDNQKQEKLLLEKACKEQVAIISREKKKRESILSEIRNKKSLTLASIESLKQSERALDKKIKQLSIRKKSVQSKKKSFTSLKGTLKMPVDGEIISSYGIYTDTEFNVKNFQSGIDIQAKKGDPVRAARGGEVVYASWFKGFGNMMILDHGGHCHTVYAHADKLLKSEGDQVKNGEVIATVGATGSLVGPVLHFEVRHHGKPIDPVKWLSKK